MKNYKKKSAFKMLDKKKILVYAPSAFLSLKCYVVDEIVAIYKKVNVFSTLTRQHERI